MEMFRQAGLFAKLSLLLGLIPFVMGWVYLVRPTERHLALMRPLSLAGLFASLAGAVIGLINALSAVWRTGPTTDVTRLMAVGTAEALVTLLVGFASLTVAWLLVAAGMSRQGDRL